MLSSSEIRLVITKQLGKKDVVPITGIAILEKLQKACRNEIKARKYEAKTIKDYQSEIQEICHKIRDSIPGLKQHVGNEALLYKIVFDV